MIKTGKINSKEAKRYLAGHLGYMKIANVKNLKEKLFFLKYRDKLKSPTLQIIELTGAGNYNNNGSNNPASNRNNNNPTNSNNNISFRPSL